MKNTTWARRIAVAGLLALSACNFSGAIGRDAVRYNESLADSANEQLLLNIARASMKHPLFFTTVTGVSRTLSSKGTLSADLPVGAGSDDKYTLKPGLELSGGPTATVAVLDSEKFMRGIMRPIDMETFAYLWNNGWPKEVLLLLFIRQFDVGPAHYVGRMYRRYPDEPLDDVLADYAAFQAELLKFARYGEVAAVTARDDVGPAVKPTKEHPLTIDGVVAAAKEGMAVTEKGGKFQVQGKKYAKTWEFKSPRPAKPGEAEVPDKMRLNLVSGDADGPEAPSGEVKAFVRSTEGILYHLGEIVRIEGELGRPPVRVFRGTVPLFSARGACAPGCCPVRAQYCGESFAVSSDPDAGESMHVLSLLSILIGLHKSADELPKGGVVTLVGG